jgi:hypothetical protein
MPGCWNGEGCCLPPTSSRIVCPCTSPVLCRPCALNSLVLSPIDVLFQRYGCGDTTILGCSSSVPARVFFLHCVRLCPLLHHTPCALLQTRHLSVLLLRAYVLPTLPLSSRNSNTTRSLCCCVRVGLRRLPTGRGDGVNVSLLIDVTATGLAGTPTILRRSGW